MTSILTFKNQPVAPYDHGDGNLWFTASQASKMLGYANVKSVTNLYNANRDEFSSSMTEVIETVTSVKSKSCSNLKTKVRIFSLRGLHLLGMLAETAIAKDLRRWALDLIEKETQPNMALMDLSNLKDVALGEMQNRVVKANEWSLETFGRPGSESLTIRKRHLKKIREAEKVLRELSQLTLPGIGDLPEGEPA